jgi:hypothetical protein
MIGAVYNFNINMVQIIKLSNRLMVIILQVCIQFYFVSPSMNRTTRTYSLKSLKSQSTFRVTSQSFAKRTNTTHTSSFKKEIKVGNYIAKGEDLIGVGSKSKVYKGVCTKTGIMVVI